MKCMYVCFFQPKFECACQFETIALDDYFRFLRAKVAHDYTTYKKLNSILLLTITLSCRNIVFSILCRAL